MRMLLFRHRRMPSNLEKKVELILKSLRVKYEREYRFHPDRKWRFDFALHGHVAIEVEGGLWIRGRHNRGAGMIADIEKYNTATLMSWRVYRIHAGMLKNGKAFELIKNIAQ